MPTTRDTIYFTITAGLGALLLFGWAAPVFATSISTNRGSHSYELHKNGVSRTGYPRTTNSAPAAYARAQSSGARQPDTSDRAGSIPTAIGTNGGTYYVEH